MSNREIFIEKLRQLSKEEMLERYIVLLDTEKLTDYVADLEAKLAESEIKYAQLRFKQLEKDVKKYKNADKELLGENINLKDKVRELEQQLAEKEKEIAYMTKQAKKFNNEAQKYFEDAYCNDTIYRDKISFAVEQLEKVKELLLENLYDLYGKPSEIWDKYGDLYDVVVEGAVNGTIDNQIKAIKGEK